MIIHPVLSTQYHKAQMVNILQPFEDHIFRIFHFLPTVVCVKLESESLKKYIDEVPNNQRRKGFLSIFSSFFEY